ncbi:MAG: hypothetical protein R3A10_17530 [Caldilineaceae bacterium]
MATRSSSPSRARSCWRCAWPKTLRASADAPGPDVTLHFTVKDTGIGIAPKDCARLFQLQPGGRVHHPTLRRHRAGLSFHQQTAMLAELMGGTMW